ncbi:MAG: Asp-tRNA(Asn)/Glu-tRNA(Gln) amidotransferase subunit GatC [Candidatus Pacebacteria bacterium]|nr:Asp-tRNA(Asn)/Glu-tRNA(Gln) amidotransferase subunit GatC [Candidatus Paceibacterota bacterium]
MDIKDVENLAELARIDLPEDEKLSLIKDFENILGYVDIIKGANVDDVELEFTHYNSWREDVETDRDFDRDLIIQQFPNKQDDFLKVKKILP